jgi:hypothetical protein
MPIVIIRKRKKSHLRSLDHSDVELFDVTYNGPIPWVKFSPFYPHGNIPVPLSPGYVAVSVEAIWHGLAVFDNGDNDISAFTKPTMSSLKQMARGRGGVRGYRAGVSGATILSEREARYQIYLPAYRWVLDNCLEAELRLLRLIHPTKTVILLDYATNPDPDDITQPLSPAALLAKYLQDQWPQSERPIEAAGECSSRS